MRIKMMAFAAAATMIGAAWAATAPGGLADKAAIAPQAPRAILPDFTEIVRDSGSAVVNIRAKRSHGDGSSWENHPFWPMVPPDLRRKLPRSEGRLFALPVQGSGFVISADGYVLTNYHVVAETEEVMVTFADGRELEAELVGLDQRTDIALLKVEADEPLPTIKIGDSKNLTVGEWVLAIGSPFGFDQTVTAGIVGAISRRLPSDNLVPFIQTDAAINPGNSGGPLINLAGEVVGVNSQIYTRTGTFAGVSFAIPINLVMEVQEVLRADGRVRRGYLGVRFDPVTEDIAVSFGLDNPTGALIQNLGDPDHPHLPPGPAEKAGLREGDIILNFDGEEVVDGNDLPTIVGGRRPGEEVDIVVWREAERMTVTAVLDEFVSRKGGPMLAWAERDSPARNLGLFLDDLDRRRSRELGVDSGVVISGFRYNDKTPTDVQKLRRGDVIAGIVVNGRVHPVESRADFNRRIANMEDGEVLTFQIVRNSGRTFVTINLEE